MSDRTQDLKNLRAVATACKNYTDNKINDLQWQLGTYDLGVETDNTSALVKTMPSGTIKSNVNKIYGKSEACSNLAPTPSWTGGYHTSSGGTWGNLSSGIRNTTKIYLKPSTQYSISFNLLLGDTAIGGRRNFISEYTSDGTAISRNDITMTTSSSNGNNVGNFTTSATTSYIEFSIFTNGMSGDYTAFFDGCITEFMINLGSTALDYEEYYSNIHNLELSGLKVEGANIFTGTWEAQTNAQIVSSTNESLKVNRTQISNSFAYKIISLKAGTYTLSFNSDGYCTYQISTESVVLSITGNVSKTFTISEDTQVIFNFTTANNNTQISITNIMLNYGSTALTYTDYVAPTTKTIDLSTILYNGSPLFEGNCLKKVSTSVDYLTPYKARKEALQIVLDGSEDENWIMATSLENRFLIQNFWDNYGVDYSDCVNSYHYNYQSSISNNYGYISRNSGQFIINFDNSSVLNLGQWKAYLQNNPLIVIFPLATPIEVSIDWSSTLRGIQGYSNGSITALNTYDMATTSEIDYLVEEVKA